MFVAPTLAPSTALIPMDTATAATSEATPAEPLRRRGGRPRRPPGIPPRARARRRPRARGGERTSGRGSLWKFILNLLLKPRYNPSIIRWEDMERGLFYFENGEEVARLRGEETQNPNKEGYGYAFMSKAMRTGNGYFTKCKEGEENVRRKFFYFGPKASWREEMARILDGCGEVSDNTLTPPNCSSDKSTRGSCC
ncbi:ETS homologous factor-like [Frankliniella occidentalis]|uniref:ETS homologous factor-like n=1 Tax=Frankliniella occidentalis TaxID=133901 RepID=A0A9C6TNT8_FRAOC|nr:ETS homologous factor-like [Frankliniella occidentalis]